MPAATLRKSEAWMHCPRVGCGKSARKEVRSVGGKLLGLHCMNCLHVTAYILCEECADTIECAHYNQKYCDVDCRREACNRRRRELTQKRAA